MVSSVYVPHLEGSNPIHTQDYLGGGTLATGIAACFIQHSKRIHLLAMLYVAIPVSPW